MDKYDVFISYQRNAQKVVEYMANAIEEKGISCWHAPQALHDEGTNMTYENIIVKGLSNASCLIAVISDEALKSEWVKNEITFANEHDIPIIPFEIAPITIQDKTTAMLATKDKIVAYENPSKSIEALIQIVNRCLQGNRSYSLKDNIRISNKDHTKTSMKYSIMSNDKGEIMLMMDAWAGEPYNPRFIYDGSGTALLYRSPKSSVAFRNIDEGAREPLKSINEILIVEILNDDVDKEYIAPVRLVKDVENLII